MAQITILTILIIRNNVKNIYYGNNNNKLGYTLI